MSFDDDKQYLLAQQSPSWMSSKPTSAAVGTESTPEWVNRDEIDSFIQQARMATGGPREHVIPIAFDKSPSSAGFGPTPFYGTSNPQFNSVVSPKVGKLGD